MLHRPKVENKSDINKCVILNERIFFVSIQLMTALKLKTVLSIKNDERGILFVRGRDLNHLFRVDFSFTNFGFYNLLFLQCNFNLKLTFYDYWKLFFKGQKRLTAQSTAKRHNAMALFMLAR